MLMHEAQNIWFPLLKFILCGCTKNFTFIMQFNDFAQSLMTLIICKHPEYHQNKLLDTVNTS